MPFLGEPLAPDRFAGSPLGLPLIDWTSDQAVGLTHDYRHDTGMGVNLVTGKLDATWQGFSFDGARRANAVAASNDGLTLISPAVRPLTMSAMFTVSDAGTLTDQWFWRDSTRHTRFRFVSSVFRMNWGNAFVASAGFGAPTDGSAFTIIYAIDDFNRSGRYGYYFRNHRTGELRMATGSHARVETEEAWTEFHDSADRVGGVHHRYRVYSDHFIDEAQALRILEDPDGLYLPEPPLYFFSTGGGGGATGAAVAGTGPASAAAAGAHGVSGTAATNTGPASASAQGVNGAAGTVSAGTGPAQASVSGTHDELPVGAALVRSPAFRAQGWGLATLPPDYSNIGDAFILEVGVPYSVNSIINGALDLIASNGIASLSDSSSHVGNAIKRNFDVERDSLLREYPWNFAMRRAKLAASSEVPAFRFKRAYELPAGPKPEFCLRVWAVGDEESRQDSDVWEISGRRLLTDLEAPLPIRYIGRIVNPALWDPLTIKALEARLAWQAAYLASGSAALAEQMARIYQERLDAAKAIDAQEGTPEPFEDGTTWIDARLTGVHW